jgi:hypothetical protein
MNWRSRRWTLPAEIARDSWTLGADASSPWAAACLVGSALIRSARPPPQLACAARSKAGSPDLRHEHGFAVGLAEWWLGGLSGLVHPGAADLLRQRRKKARPGGPLKLTAVDPVSTARG